MNIIFKQIRTTDDRVKIEAISNGTAICEKWTDMVEKFTTLFWPHHSLHSWKGANYIPERCSRIGKRLRYLRCVFFCSWFEAQDSILSSCFRQIGELRAQYRQLTRLLTSNERSGLGTDNLMQCLDDIRGISRVFNIIYCFLSI